MTYLNEESYQRLSVSLTLCSTVLYCVLWIASHFCQSRDNFTEVDDYLNNWTNCNKLIHFISQCPPIIANDVCSDFNKELLCFQAISAPSAKVMSPISSPVSPSSQSKSPITKIYTDKINVDSDGEESAGKQTRVKPASDITQIYTQKIAQVEYMNHEPPQRTRP